MASCSVVMVSYYTGMVLFPAIKSVLSQADLAELIVVDNGNVPSTLGRLQKMAQGDARLKILTGGGNVGFAKGCNEGANFARGEFLLFLNPDCLLPPDALSDLMRAFDELPGAQVVGALLQNPDGTDQRSYRHAPLTPFSAFSFSRREPVLPQKLVAVASVSSACLCVRRAEFLSENGFDAAYFVYLAGRDFCLRTTRRGGKVVIAASVRVTRLLGASGQMPSRFVQWQIARSLMHYFHAHFGRVGAVLADGAILVRFAWRLIMARFVRRFMPRRDYASRLAARKLILLACGLAELPPSQELSGKIVVVTGATGQLGLCVVRRLIAAGAGVLAISREENIAFSHAHLRWLKGNLSDAGFSLREYLADAVIHCAPLEQLPAIVHTLADSEVQRVVAFGSASVFSEAMSPNPHVRDEVAHMVEAEDEIAIKCNARGMDWTILRPTLAYGYGLDKEVSLLARLIRRFGFFLVYPPANGRRQPVHVDDLAQAAISALGASATYGKSYNLGGGEALPYRQMIERIFATGSKKTRIFATRALPFMLDAAGRVLQKKALSGEVARRMNEDIVFFHDEPVQDFGFAPRAFLSGGAKDLGGF